MEKKITMSEFCKLIGKTEEQIKTGSLDLRGTGITSLPEGLTVGGILYLEGTGITDTSMVNRNFSVDLGNRIWANSKFICADGVFTEALSHHGNVWEVKKVASTKSFYLVTDGNGKYAHGDTIQKAKEDLIYKIANRDKSKYQNLTLDSVLTFEQAIECYRVITGACSLGTKNFVEAILPDKDKKRVLHHPRNDRTHTRTIRKRNV